ncbi:MAG: hypothetical protein V4590_09980 [Bacteroidota bacterium]
MKYLLYCLCILCFVFPAASQQSNTYIDLRNKKTEEVWRSQTLPARIKFKLKDESGFTIHHATIYNLNDSMLFLTDGNLLFPVEKEMDWKKVKWVVFLKPPATGVAPAGIMYASYIFTGFSLLLLTGGIYGISTGDVNSGVGIFAVGIVSGLITIPAVLLTTKSRYKKYRPEDFKIERHTPTTPTN